MNGDLRMTRFSTAMKSHAQTGRRALRTMAAMSTLASAAVVAACGGGSGDDRCSESTNLFLSVSWTVNGVLNQSIVQGRVGQALVADPVISGLPASCIGRVTYRLLPDVLAPGLTLNASTGRIRGTATQPKDSQSLAGFTIQPEGYFESSFPFRVSITP